MKELEEDDVVRRGGTQCKSDRKRSTTSVQDMKVECELIPQSYCVIVVTSDRVPAMQETERKRHSVRTNHGAEAAAGKDNKTHPRRHPQFRKAS